MGKKVGPAHGFASAFPAAAAVADDFLLVVEVVEITLAVPLFGEGRLKDFDLGNHLLRGFLTGPGLELLLSFVTRLSCSAHLKSISQQKLLQRCFSGLRCFAIILVPPRS